MNILQTVFVLAATTLLPYAAAQPLRHGSGTGSDASGIGSKFIAVSDAVAEPLGGPDPPGVLVGPSTHDARQRKRDVEEDGAKDGYGPASIEPHHQDDALDVDGVGGELTADASWCMRSNQRGGYACCSDSNCRSNVCIHLICRDCRYDSNCRGSDKYCTGFTEGYVCKKKGGIGAACDVTGVTNGNGSRPCGDGLTCGYAGGGDHKCMPSGNGCIARALYDFTREDIGSRYEGVNGEAEGILEGAGSGVDAEDLVNSVTGDSGLLDRIKVIARDSEEIVTMYKQIIWNCFDNDMKLGVTQGLGSNEEDDSSFVLMAGASVDGTAGVMGATLGFGLAIELNTQPKIAMYVTACAGLSLGYEASIGMSAALQFGGGFGATAGWATEYIEPDIGVGAGASASFSISNSDPAYATFALSIGVGYGASVDIGNQCYAKVYEF